MLIIDYDNDNKVDHDNYDRDEEVSSAGTDGDYDQQ